MNYITILELCNYVEELENVCISKQIGKGTPMAIFFKKRYGKWASNFKFKIFF